MARTNALSLFINLMHGDRASTLAQAREAFAEDFGHFARSNNREPLNVAVASLAKGPKDKAIGEAINSGYKASGLVTGYIGAQSGKFTAQSDEVRATYENAIMQACEAFANVLETCEAFAAKVQKTTEEKAKAKAEKEDKASEAINALITAKVQSGELVRAVDVKPFPQELLDSLKLTIETLQAENATLQAENATLQAENATLQAKPTAKKSKATA